MVYYYYYRLCCVVFLNTANTARPFGTTTYGMVINSVAIFAEGDRSNLGLAESCVENTGFFLTDVGPKSGGALRKGL